MYLYGIAENKPEYISKVLDLYKLGLNFDKNGYFTLSLAYQSLASIAKRHPKDLPQILEVYKQALVSQKM